MSSRQAILLIAPFLLGMLLSYVFVLTPAREKGGYAVIPASEDRNENASSGVERDDDGDATIPGYESVVFGSLSSRMSPRRTADSRGFCGPTLCRLSQWTQVKRCLKKDRESIESFLRHKSKIPITLRWLCHVML